MYDSSWYIKSGYLRTRFGGGRVDSRGIVVGRGRGATQGISELQAHQEIATSQPDLFATPESQT